jgi:hypothetical protein
VSDFFQPPPIPEAQLRELQRAIAWAAIDRMIEEMKRPGALSGGTPGPDEEHDHADSTVSAGTHNSALRRLRRPISTPRKSP